MEKRHYFYLIRSYVILFSCFSALSSFTVPLDETESRFQPWRIQSLREDGNLQNKNIFFIDFDSRNNAWIATSQGLYMYDGLSWKEFTEKDGLPSSFVRCVLVAQDGSLWVGTDKGAGVFDGQVFDTMGSEHHLASPSIRRIRQDEDGTIWFCCDNWPSESQLGGLTSYQEGIWKTYTTDDGLPTAYIMDYFKDSLGRQFIISRQGIAQKEGERWVRPLGIDDPTIVWTITETKKLGVVTYINDRLLFLKQNAYRRVSPPVPQNYLFLTTSRGELLTVGHLGKSLFFFLQWKENQFRPVSQSFLPPTSQVECIREAPDGSIWCSGYDFLIRWDRSKSGWIRYDIPVPSPMFLDNRNRIWFQQNDKYVRLQDEKIKNIQPPLSYAESDEKGNVWGGGEQGLICWREKDVQSFTPGETGIQHPQGVNLDARGNTWIYGLDQQGKLILSIYNNSSWNTLHFSEWQGWDIIGRTPDKTEGIWYTLRHRDDPGRMQIVHIKNHQLYPLASIPRVPPYIRPSICIDSVQNFWFFNIMGLYRSSPPYNQWKRVADLPGNNVRVCLDGNQELWFGYNGVSGGRSGWSRYRDGQWTHFDTSFQPAGQIADTGKAYLGGYQRIYIGSPDQPHLLSSLYVPAIGSINNFVVDHNQHIWVGQRSTLLRYIPENDPPDTHMSLVNTSVLHGNPLRGQCWVIRPFRSKKSNRDDYHFSYKIDESPWSPFLSMRSLNVSTKNLKPGKHVFSLRSQGPNSHIDPTPAVVEFQVLPLALQDRPWFRPALILLFILITALALYAFSTKKQLIGYTKNLETQIQIRTASLQQSEELFRGYFELGSIGMTISSPDMKWMQVNHRLCDILGYSRDELIDMSWEPITHPDDIEPNVELLNRVLKGEIDEFSMEKRFISKKGTIVPTEMHVRGFRKQDGSLDHFIGHILDITERKKAEEALKKSEQIYREAIEVAGAIPYYQNYETDTYDYVTPAIQNLIGYPAHEFTPQLWQSITEEILLLGGLEGMHLEDAVDKARGEEGLSWRADYRIRTRSGKEKWVSNAAVQVRDESGKVVGSLGILQDISDRKRLEEQLLHSQKMDAIGQLAGGIAHDFNNLLTGILGFSDLLLSNLDESHPHYSALDGIRKASETASSLTRQLLAFSRKQILEPVTLDIAYLIEYLESMLRRLLGETIHLQTRMDEQLHNIKADRGQMEQILVNLVVNARDAMPQGGNLTLSASNKEVAPADSLNLGQMPTGSYVLLSVEDTGHGMDKTTLKAIFEPFFTTKGKGKGTGLGLSTVYGIVKQSGGYIFVESEVGKGTRFDLYFPAVKNELPQESIEIPSNLLQGNETILLVEDEEMVRDLVTEVLESHGYQVQSAENAEEAQILFDQQQTPFDLMVTDVVLPTLNGHELALQFQQKQADLKVLYMSGYTDNAIVHQGQLDDGLLFIHKPFTPDKFLKKVRSVLDA